jgi:hypothetical protein
MSHEPGGGIASKNVVHSRNPKTEPVAKAVRPGEADYLGQALAYEPPDLYDGEGYNAPPRSTPWSVGVGVGREVMSSGSQGHHGPARQGEPDRAPDVPATRGGRDILKDYGPESS